MKAIVSDNKQNVMYIFTIFHTFLLNYIASYPHIIPVTPSYLAHWDSTETKLCDILIYAFQIRVEKQTQIAELTNSIDLDEVAHNEPPHLDLHCVSPIVFEFLV